MKQRNSALILVLFIVGITFLIAYFSSNNSSVDVNKSNSEIASVEVGSYKNYTNKKYVVSFDYPSDWIYDEKTTNTLSGADRITVALKESQYKKGMGTSWMNVSVVNSLDAKDITVFGNKVNVSSVNGIRADVWENQSTNQKYLVFQSNGKTYVIQSRTTYKDDNLEDIYRHLLESFNTNPQ